MQTLTEIANMALNVIGHHRINNIDTDQQDFAKTVRDVIYVIIREEQSNYNWPELKKEVTLEQSATQPDDGTYVAYNIPTDVIKMNRLTTNAPYIHFGNAIRVSTSIMTPSVAPVMEYQSHSLNVDGWSTWLSECIYTKLALQLAMPLAQEPGVAQLAEARYDKAVAKRAKAFQSSASPVRRRRGTDWNTSRNNSGYGVYDRGNELGMGYRP